MTSLRDCDLTATSQCCWGQMFNHLIKPIPQRFLLVSSRHLPGVLASIPIELRCEDISGTVDNPDVTNACKSRTCRGIPSTSTVVLEVLPVIVPLDHVVSHVAFGGFDHTSSPSWIVALPLRWKKHQQAASNCRRKQKKLLCFHSLMLIMAGSLYTSKVLLVRQFMSEPLSSWSFGGCA